MNSPGARTQELILGALVLALTGVICAALLLGLGIAPQGAAALLANATRPLVAGAGVLATLALTVAAAWLQMARAREARAAREARTQIRALLETAQEGFFLLDADLRIGAVASKALVRIFGRQEFAGVAFEELLYEFLPQETLATAVQEIKLLWQEKHAPEKPLHSVPALNELEVRVDNGRGGRDTRYLQFNFRRLVTASGFVQVLVSIDDVTANVLLARELADARSNADLQVDMLFGVMQVDPLQLGAFLDATEAGLQLVNAILKEPARSDADFRRKIDRLFCELHAIKGDASALGITGIAQFAHRFENLLSELKERPELTGADFLCVVLRLSELLAQLRSIRDLGARVASLRDGAGAAGPHALAAEERGAADELAASLRGLATRLERDQQKKFRLSLHGLAQIPQDYRTTVRDLLIQLLRNSAVHGIEPADVRRARNKAELGLVRADFRSSDDGYELVFEDDGAGLALEKLKTAAIRKHITTAAEAARMDTRAAMGLIFRAGVSTCDRVTMDAGRGVGMEVVARRIAALGGKIVLSTDPGKFTRVKIALPPIEAAKSAVA
jgi:HPt (histidine-containing phosphotransfer) domain-containing protein/PAS domain-containing protein